LAMDFSSAQVVQSAFINSSSHKANILSDKYTEIGIALQLGEIDGRETIVLAEFFAQPKVTSSLAAASVSETTETTTQEEIVIEEEMQPEPTEEIVPEETTINIETETVDISQTEVLAQETETTNEPAQVVETFEFNNQPVAEQEVAIETESGSATTTVVTNIAGNILNEAQLVSVRQSGAKPGLVDLLVSWTRNFITLMLVIISLLLLVNIIIKTRVQHAHVIVHSLVALAVIASMLFIHFHMIEKFIIF